MRIIAYEDKYRDDLIFMALEAKNALNRIPTLNSDLLNINEYYLDCGGMFWIAVDENDRVIGCVGCNILENNVAVLHRLYVKYNMKRQGIGTKLLAAAQQFAKEQKCSIMKLHLGNKDTYFESRPFYLKHGYVYEDRDHMSKNLHSIPEQNNK